jgi:hypothetical protein
MRNRVRRLGAELQEENGVSKAVAIIEEALDRNK